MKEVEYCISVGEPWDFSGPDGQNIIKGTILKKINSNLLIFKSTFLQILPNNLEGNIFLLTPRYQNDEFSNSLKKLSYITVNVALLRVEYSDKLTEQELKENSSFVIIGSIKQK